MDEESGLRPIQETEASFQSDVSFLKEDRTFQDEYTEKKGVGSPTMNSEKDHRLNNETTTTKTTEATQMGTMNVNPVTPNNGNSGVSEGQTTMTTPDNHPPLMSAISKMFDRNGKGYLDSTERALRKLDTDNDGMLTIHNVYDIMRSLQEAQKLSNDLMGTLQDEQRRSSNLKRSVIVLVALAMMLSVANIGTSFAAARLAKDTKISNGGDLVSKDTNNRVGTTDKIVGVDIRPVTHEARRRLQGMNSGFDFCTQLDKKTNSRHCMLQGVLDRGVAFDIYRQFCPAMTTPSSEGCPSLNGGVEKLHMACNGRYSILLGGLDLPEKGPITDFMGYTWYPTMPDFDATIPTEFKGEIHVPDPFNGSCVQHFETTISCPEGDENTECGLWAHAVEPLCTIFQGTPEDNEHFDSDGLLLCPLLGDTTG